MPSFNPSVIPPENRTKAAMAIHIEMYKRSLDTWRVHNPTEEDFVVYNDRKVTNERYIIPNKNKDVGKGHGNLDVPSYIMERYVQHMGTKLISDISKKDWDEKKMQYRFDERGDKEEKMAIRTDDPKQWEKIMPILVKGIVKRYQGDNIADDIPDEPEKKYNSIAEQMIDKLNLNQELETNTPIQQSDIEDKKQNLINQLT